MLYVGLDSHWNQSTFCVLDEHGRKVRTRTVRGQWPKVLAELETLERPWAVCFEASTGYGFLFERLSALAKRVVVAHPGQLRLIFRSKRKTDRIDAEKLAKLLFLDRDAYFKKLEGEKESKQLTRPHPSVHFESHI